MSVLLPEDELWYQVQTDAPGAFKRFYYHFHQTLCNYAAMILQNEDDVEEVVNDLFIYMWTHRHIVKVTKSIRSYLLSSIHNRCIDFIRAGHTAERLDEAVTERSILLDPDLERLDVEDISRIVDAAVGDLSEKSREVFVKSRKEGLSDKSIAAKMNISVKTVEAHKTKALKSIELALGNLYPFKGRK